MVACRCELSSAVEKLLPWRFVLFKEFQSLIKNLLPRRMSSKSKSSAWKKNLWKVKKRMTFPLMLLHLPFKYRSLFITWAGGGGGLEGCWRILVVSRYNLPDANPLYSLSDNRSFPLFPPENHVICQKNHPTPSLQAITNDCSLTKWY